MACERNEVVCQDPFQMGRLTPILPTSIREEREVYVCIRTCLMKVLSKKKRLNIEKFLYIVLDLGVCDRYVDDFDFNNTSTLVTLDQNNVNVMLSNIHYLFNWL